MNALSEEAARSDGNARAETVTYLLERRSPILARAERLLTARSGRYADLEPCVSRTRLELLFTSLVESLAGGSLRPLVEHADAVAHDRFHSGFALADVQAAYNALEEAVWTQVFHESTPTCRAAVLPLVSGALGAAKDALARDYVGLATDAHAPSIDVAALFRGVASP